MKIVVIGASGFTGSKIAAELVSRGHEVVGVARNVDTLAGIDGLTAAAGSIHDLAFLERVATGANAVVVAIPGRATETSPALHEVIKDAAATVAKVGARLGVVGGAGSLFTHEGGPRLFDTPEFPAAFAPEAKGVYEVLVQLQQTPHEIDWFFVSPAAGYGKHAPGERLGHYRVGGDVVVKDVEGKSFISVNDFAIAFADELEAPTHHRVRFTVGY